MNHLRRHIIERARPLLNAFAIAGKLSRSGYDCVCFIGCVPVLAHMDRFWCAYKQTCSMRLWVDMQNTNLRGILAEIRNNPFPLEVCEVLELWCVRDRLTRRVFRASRKHQHCRSRHYCEAKFDFHTNAIINGILRET